MKSKYFGEIRTYPIYVQDGDYIFEIYGHHRNFFVYQCRPTVLCVFERNNTSLIEIKKFFDICGFKNIKRIDNEEAKRLLKESENEENKD